MALLPPPALEGRCRPSCAAHRYEATHLIVKPNEADATALWGSAILAGFLCASVMELAVTTATGPGHPEGAATRADSASTPAEVAMTDAKPDGCAVEVAVGAVSLDGVDGAPKLPGRARILSGIILGDFMHNLARPRV